MSDLEIIIVRREKYVAVLCDIMLYGFTIMSFGVILSIRKFPFHKRQSKRVCFADGIKTPICVLTISSYNVKTSREA